MSALREAYAPENPVRDAREDAAEALAVLLGARPRFGASDMTEEERHECAVLSLKAADQEALAEDIKLARERLFDTYRMALQEIE